MSSSLSCSKEVLNRRINYVVVEDSNEESSLLYWSQFSVIVESFSVVFSVFTENISVLSNNYIFPSDMCVGRNKLSAG